MLTLLMLLTSTATQSVTQSEYSDVTGRRLWNRSVLVLLGAKQCVCVHPMMQYMVSGEGEEEVHCKMIECQLVLNDDIELLVYN